MEDAEWAFFEPLLSAIRGRGGRPHPITALFQMLSSGLLELDRLGATCLVYLANGRVSIARSNVGPWPVCGR